MRACFEEIGGRHSKEAVADRVKRSVLRRHAEWRYKSKYRKVGVLPIRIVWSNVSSIGPSSERNRSIGTRSQPRPEE